VFQGFKDNPVKQGLKGQQDQQEKWGQPVAMERQVYPVQSVHQALEAHPVPLA
jgi:hypothetical protein